MADSYKNLKEDFVSNLTGGEISEINYVTAVAPISVFLYSVLQSRQSFFVPYGRAASVTDFLLTCASILLATTAYSSSPLLLNILLLSPAVLLYLLPRQTAGKKVKRNSTQTSNGHGETSISQSPLDQFPYRPFLTVYRGSMMVITCIAILAVDFRIFPRRFAKVENWGTSLMDLGVGSFVFSAGVVSVRPLLKEQHAGRSTALGKRLYASARHSLPLLALGLVRLYSVKGLDYAEHVSEYGVHWNFFFTLAFLPPFVALFQTAFQFIPSYSLLAVMLGAGYQAALTLTDLQAFILTAPRTDLFSKNREGIFSFFGYLAIFLGGQAIGTYVLPRGTTHRASDADKQRKTLLYTLASCSVLWVLLFNLSTGYSYGLRLRVSRRLANLPYFLWVVAFNCCQMTLFCAIETLCFPGVHKATDGETERERCTEATSPILHAYNRNGLAIFLLANLLTGAVNLTLPTLHMGSLQAMAVLVIYLASLTGVAVALDRFDISIKL